MRRAPVLVLLCASGCFQPSYPDGLACGENNFCPAGQQCGSDGHCHGTGQRALRPCSVCHAQGAIWKWKCL